LKALSRIFPILILVFFVASVPQARAQGLSAWFGVGTAQAPALKGSGIDTFGDGNLQPTPPLGGTFASFGGDFMFRSYLGFGAEYAARFSRTPYAGLNYEPSFYDFNAVFMPLPKAARIVPELQAGIGGVNLQFYYNQQFCDAFAGCNTSNSFIESSNHFQVHGGVGVRFYLNHLVFIRPQFDIHYVNNFFQFGSNWVPQYSIAVGITTGRR
jgi:hypothetical protein